MQPDQPRNPSRDRRWPRSLYGIGTDPDPRFTLANERTLLAWIRTALAFSAGGLALLLAEELLERWSSFLPASAFSVALVIVAGALTRWYRTEKALRLGVGIPPPWVAFGVIAVLSIALAGGFVAALAVR